MFPCLICELTLTGRLRLSETMWTILVSLTLPLLTTGLEIVTYSGAELGVRSGEALELSCEADVEYRWCYWEHDHIK